MKQFLAIFILTLGLVTFTAARGEAQYTITSLGHFDGEAQAYDINDAGQVTGWLKLEDGSRRGFAWENGNLEILPPLPDSNMSEGVAIDASGTIAGNSELMSDTVGRNTRGVVWQNTGAGWVITRTLNPNYAGTFGADQWSEVLGMGESGQALGWSPFSHQGGIIPSATIWLNEGGLPLDLNFCKACHQTQAYDLDPSGVVAVGNRKLPTGSTGIIRGEAWRNLAGQWLPLPFTTSVPATVYAINNTHTMVGTIGTPKQAALWTETSHHNWAAATLLGDLGRGSEGSVAYDINNDGKIVGQVKTITGPRAFIYENGVMQDLNDLIEPGTHWKIEAARAINNSGSIVGWGQYLGQTRAVLLTPLP